MEERRKEPHRFRAQIALSDIHNTVVQRGLDIWQHARGSRPYPSRAEMSPRILSDILRNTILVRVLQDGDEFQLRIVGDAMVEAQGMSMQGMTMAEIDLVLPGHGTTLRYIYRTTLEEGAPLAFRGRYTRQADDRSLFHETLLLPLGPDASAIDHLLVVSVFAFDDLDLMR